MPDLTNDNLPAIQDTHAVATPTAQWSLEQLDLVKRTICRGGTNDELALFQHVCEKAGLDPFARQIYAVKRWDSASKKEVMAIQTGIDGFRLIADRTGKYAGSDDPIFDEGISQYEHIKSGRGNPTIATVTVYKIVANQRVPFTASANWEAYKGTKKGGGLTHFWATKGYLMLSKCAESLALRKAFPAELSGLYTRDEMQQADNVTHEHQVNESHGPTQDLVDKNGKTDNEKCQLIGERLIETEGSKNAAIVKFTEISAFTDKDGKPVAGVTTPRKLSGRWLNTAYGKVKAYHAKWVEEQGDPTADDLGNRLADSMFPGDGPPVDDMTDMRALAQEKINDADPDLLRKLKEAGHDLTHMLTATEAEIDALFAGMEDDA